MWPCPPTSCVTPPMNNHTRATCTDCGDVHLKCTGHRKTDHRPCGMNPAEGADVCRMHGGGAPQVKAAAKNRVREQIAASAAARFALPVEISPSDGLLAEVHRTAGAIAWLEAQVERVTGDTPDNLIYGVRKTKEWTGGEEGGGSSTESGPGVNDWLQLWQKERRHFVEVCRVTLAAGIEQKRVELAQQQAQMIVTVLKGVFADLVLTAEQEALVPMVVPKHLRLVQTSA